MNMARRRWLTIAAAAALGLTGCDTDTQHAIDQCRLDLSRYHIEDWHTAVYMDECMKVAGYTLIANDHWSVDSYEYTWIYKNKERNRKPTPEEIRKALTPPENLR